MVLRLSKPSTDGACSCSISQYLRPISPEAVGVIYNESGKRAGINVRPEGKFDHHTEAKIRYPFHGHECRDTLVTLSRKAEVPEAVANFFIGHHPASCNALSMNLRLFSHSFNAEIEPTFLLPIPSNGRARLASFTFSLPSHGVNSSVGTFWDCFELSSHTKAPLPPVLALRYCPTTTNHSF